MRRISASLLLALLCFGFALPFLQAQRSSIPACCRRDGKHHCAMSANGNGFRTSAANCPCRHLSVLASRSIGLKVSSSVLSISTHGLFPIRNEQPLIALRASDNTQKRGPPVS
jgi:hypothetical protein